MYISSTCAVYLCYYKHTNYFVGMFSVTTCCASHFNLSDYCKFEIYKAIHTFFSSEGFYFQFDCSIVASSTGGGGCMRIKSAHLIQCCRTSIRHCIMVFLIFFSVIWLKWIWKTLYEIKRIERIWNRTVA